MIFLILAVSYKHGGLCVAGLNYDTFEYVRIGKARANDATCYPLLTADLKLQDRTLRICDLVDIEVIKLPIIGCQTENYELKKINGFIKTLTSTDLLWVYMQVQHYPFIFCNCEKTLPSERGKFLTSSIGFFKVSDMRVGVNYDMNGTPKYKAGFTYNGNKYMHFSLTDCAICGYPHDLYGGKRLADRNNRLVRIGDAYIMITLPSKPWAVDDCYYKYISGVIACK